MAPPAPAKHTGRGYLRKTLHSRHFDGNIIREALKSGTEMGKRAKSYMDEGKLVPDEVVIGIIKDRLAQDDCKNGFILDGFPRTIPQAEALDAMGVVIDRVIDIEVPDDKIVTRMSGRRVCESAAPATTCSIRSLRWKASAASAEAPLFSARTTTPIPSRSVCACITSRPNPSGLLREAGQAEDRRGTGRSG